MVQQWDILDTLTVYLSKPVASQGSRGFCWPSVRDVDKPGNLQSLSFVIFQEFFYQFSLRIINPVQARGRKLQEYQCMELKQNMT